MDVYNDTPTIVTTWLTILPKLSILILLLELYLQIDNFESYIFIFNPFIDIIYSIPLFYEHATDYFEHFGGTAEVYKNPGIAAVSEYIFTGTFVLFNRGLHNLIRLFIDFDAWYLFDALNKWQVVHGGGSAALHNLLFVSSLLSLIIGTVLGLAQSQIKRLMAYSTIAHLGFILLALSINTEEALDSFLFYIIQYTITNLNVFLIIIAFNYLLCSLVKNNLVIKDIKYISELTNQYNKNPILTISFIICLLSMAGRLCPMFQTSFWKKKQKHSQTIIK